MEENEALRAEILSLKAEIYDTARDHATKMAELTNVYSAALLRAAGLFNVKFEGRAPSNVAEFQVALNEIEEKDYVQGP